MEHQDHASLRAWEVSEGATPDYPLGREEDKDCFGATDSIILTNLAFFARVDISKHLIPSRNDDVLFFLVGGVVSNNNNNNNTMMK